MTKYILHGGATRNISKDNKRFFSEITNGLNEPINILCAYFSKDEEFWLDLFNQDKINFSSVAPNKTLNFVLADANQDKFIQQIKDSDVIYFRGGNTEMLKNHLINIKNLENLWQGKVVAGSSAGAYILTKYYFNNDDQKIYSGFNILPIKLIAHYSPEKTEALEKLEKYGENLEVYKIPEEKFFIIEK
jgi:hypothetical protein